MKKKVVIFILSIFLIHVGLFAQSVYSEMGFNSLSKINYKNSNNIDFTSTNAPSQFRYEIGLRTYVSEKFIAYFGFSTDKYSFNLDNEDQAVKHNVQHIESLYELDYLGVNLGVDYSFLKEKKWDLFACGKFSRNVLSQGLRTDRVINTSSTYSLPGSNLVQDSDFSQLRYNVQFGLAADYRISRSASLYTSYNFSQSLTTTENNQESYDFSAHVLSFGLRFHIEKHPFRKEQVFDSGSANDLETESQTESFFINQTNTDSSLKTVDKFYVKDSTLLKVYFPPESMEFYDSHTKALEEMAELLLEDTSVRYTIIGYYDGLSDKDNGIARVRSVLGFFTDKGIATEQFVRKYYEEHDQYSTSTNVWSRRVEILKVNQ